MRTGLRRHFVFVAVALLVIQVAAELGGPQQPNTPDNPALTALRFIGPGGADAVGPGPADVRGFVRVADGDTLDVTIRNQRVAVGLLGVVAPQGNTECGRQATNALTALTKGGVHFEDDPSVTFDSRLRRMYHAVALDGRAIGAQLARDGLAVGDGRGSRSNEAFSAELEARAAGRGCAWRNVPPPRSGPGGRMTRTASDLGALVRGIGDAVGSFAAAALPIPSAAAAATTGATILPTGFTQDVISAGLPLPTAMAFLPDGRILVTTKAGTVRVIKNGSLLPAPFIDITDHVNSYFDHGLLGITADPNFATNGFVYLLYTYEDNSLAFTAPKAGRLSRVTAVGDTASPSSELALVGTVVGGSCNDHPAGADCIPNDNLSHTEGNLKFAADGSLFVTLGDGSSFSTVDANALRTQNLDSLAGKILHIMPNGLGAPENPFYNGDPTANRSKIWAYGVRNAYRFSIRPSNGHLYVGDVGWNDIEEVDVVPPGANLGWPCYEGPLIQVGYQSFPVCQALYAAGTARPPLTSYSHSNGSTAVTGGVFYTGTVYPAQFQGAYFYGDYGQSFLRTFRVDANDNLTASPTDFASAADGPVDIEVGPDQNIYYLAINTGELRRIRFVGNAPPTAVASVSPNNGLAPLTVSFSSAGSFDPESETLSFSWNFGDGSLPSTLANPNHTYTANGTYTATLTVSDPSGVGTPVTTRVVVGNVAPTATITSPLSTLLYKVGDVITFAGAGSDPENGAIPPTGLFWQVIVHHCPQGSCHTHFLFTTTGNSGQLTVPDHGDDVFLEIQLTATDSVGLTGSASVTIHPQTSQVTLLSTPASAQVIYDGSTSAAPLVHTSVVGSTHSIDTPSPQGNNTFGSWSDGGAQHHNIVIGATNVTYTVTFNVATATSLALNGTSAWASAPHNPELNTTGDWTVETWFKEESPSGYNHDTAYIVIKGNTDVEGEANYLVGVAWGSLFAGERTGWANQLVSASLIGTSINAWHHVAATLVASTRLMTIYLDGTQMAQATLVGISPTGSSAALWIGRNGSGSGLWRGKLDDLRIWNVARSAADVAANYRTELASAPAGLVGNWKFDEAGGTVAADTTAIQENATLAPTATWSPDVGNGPPPPPPPTAISGVSAGTITNGSALITWTTNNPATSQVEYGTTTAYGGSTIQDSALVVTHNQQLSGLAASTLYHYRVRSVDGGGTVVVTTDFTFTTAAPPPPTAISAVAATGIVNTAATIGWTTNNPATSQVDYGTTIAYGSSTGADPALVTGHSQLLSGLTVNTLYHYRVRGTDAGGTAVVSADFTFTTANTPPLNSLLLNGTNSYAEAPLAAELNITGDWTTEAWFRDESPGGYNHDTSYIVMKGNTDIDSEGPYYLGVAWNSLIAGERTAWTNNSMAASLIAVTPNAWHHAAASFVATTRTLTLYLDGVQVAQGVLPARTTIGNGRPLEIGRNGNASNMWRGKVDDVRIWNVARTTSDISGSFRSELLGAPATLVGNWKFNEGSGTTAADSTATPQNAVLQGGATWSTDVGNVPPVPDTTPPVISAVGPSAITSASVSIGWTTDEIANSQVDYGPTVAYGTSTVLNPALVTTHAQQLTGLAPSTLYHFRVRSSDAAGNPSASGDLSFTTAAADTTPPVLSLIVAGGISNTAATISWTTDEVADSQVDFGTTTAYGSSTTLDPALVTGHSQPLGGLVVNTLYHFRVRSRDAAGNPSASADFTFTTTNAPAVNSLLLTGGAAEAPNATELNITGNWTLETWFKDETPGVPGFQHDFEYMVMKGNTDATPEAPYFIGIGWNSLFAGSRTGWTSFTLTASLAGVSATTWHHAAASFVAATRTMTLYLDGVQMAQGVIGAATTSGNAMPVEIGRNGNGAGAWRGKLDDVRIWNIARTTADISANFRTELATAPAGLVANWKFNEGSGTTAADSTATPENAVLLTGSGWSTDIHP